MPIALTDLERAVLDKACSAHQAKNNLFVPQLELDLAISNQQAWDTVKSLIDKGLLEVKGSPTYVGPTFAGLNYKG